MSAYGYGWPGKWHAKKRDSKPVDPDDLNEDTETEPSVTNDNGLLFMVDLREPKAYIWFEMDDDRHLSDVRP